MYDLNVIDFLSHETFGPDMIAISVWCETFFANFGEVIIPTTLFGLTTTESGPKLLCSGPVEVSLGALPTRGHRVSGQIFALSERVLEIRGFVYDGCPRRFLLGRYECHSNCWGIYFK